MAGNNVLLNPSFDEGATAWTVTEPAVSDIIFANSSATLIRETGAANLGQGNRLTAGFPWVIDIQVSNVVGSVSFGANFAGQLKTVTTPGRHQHIIPLPGSASLLIILNQNNSQATIEWVTARRMDLSMSKVTMTLRDYDGDKKRTSLELGPVTDGASYVTREAAAAAIRDAVNAVAGNMAAYEFAAVSTEPNDINTATPVYQTHVRWIVELFDSVTGDGPYAFDIPTADLGNGDLFLPASQEHDPAAAEWIALKAALNGIAINPRTGSTMTVGRIYLEE